MGYAPPLPPRLARFVRGASGSLLAAAIVAATVASIGHVRLDGGSFEFGVTRRVTGTLVQHPYPALIPDGRRNPASWTLLVAPGKHGADALVAGLAGRHVSLTGTQIERQGLRMLEVGEGSVVPSSRGPESGAGSGPGHAPTAGETLTLRGEIVDSKCFLGVMVPGQGSTHARCASLCLRGGIPPGFFVRDREGRSTLLLLEGPRGEALHGPAVDYAGQAIEVTGVTGRRGGWSILRTDPATWRRVSSAPAR